MAVTEKKTYCRVCGSLCGVFIDLDGDQVLKLRGDPAHEMTAGYTCSKGRGLPAVHHSPDRLTFPQMRLGGALRRTGWDEALDDLAARLRRIIDESGPEAVGVFLGGGGYMDSCAYFVGRNLPQALGTPSLYSDMTIDVISKFIVSEMMAGVGGMMTRPDYARCRLVLYVGTNPAVSHGHTSAVMVPANQLRELTARGEVWVLDPRYTETAMKATRHLRPTPGGDYAALAFLVREILREGADHDYLAAHAQDVEALAEAVEPYDLAAAARISGVPADDLRALLVSVRAAGRLCVETGTGVSMSRAANVVQWLAWALMAVTGSLDREGGAWVNPGFLMRLEEMDIPPAPPEGWRRPGPRSRPELLTVGGEYPCAALPDEIEAGHLRAIINLSGNLVACMPQTDRLLAALGKLEALATIEIAATPTTAISTHVFPAKDQLERADLPYALDGAYPAIATQYTGPIVAPPPDVRSYWWTLAQLGKRLGIELVPGLDPDAATDEDVIGMIAARARLDIEALRAGELVVAEPVAIGWLQKRVDRIGGWRLAPRELVAQLAEMQPPAELVLIPRRQHHHINSRIMDPRDQPAILVSEEDAMRVQLRDGARAVVRSPHGQIEGVVRIDRTLPRGVMNVPHGFAGAYNVNQLTSCDDVDPLTGMPRMSGLPVTLHPTPEPELA
jgi:anaerobic selenocysteine-containing dehydrogenase